MLFGHGVIGFDRKAMLLAAYLVFLGFLGWRSLQLLCCSAVDDDFGMLLVAAAAAAFLWAG